MLQSCKAFASEALAQKCRAWGTYASAERQHCGVPRRALDRAGQTRYCKTPRGDLGSDAGEIDVLDLMQTRMIRSGPKWDWMCTVSDTQSLCVT